jgi:FtsP/CotA-like multicopper oxidase with cupredoxin domain
MNILYRTLRTSGVILIAVAAAALLLSVDSVQAQARIDGITGPGFSFTAKAGELTTPDGGSIHFWGYTDNGGSNNGVVQYPGPTLILTQGIPVTVTLTSELPFGQAASIVFPGHQVTATGGSPGLLTQESTGPADTVTYEFTPPEPGTYMYYSGTRMELQVEMGMLGAIIVRPDMGETYAYNHADTRFDHEYLFLLTSLDPVNHQLAEQGRFSEIDTTNYWPVYWFINGRAAFDTVSPSFAAWLPHQPYNILPRMTPGQKLLMRVIGAGQVQHPFHFHGNNADIIARDGRMLATNSPTSGPDLKRSVFTKLTVPGETVDQIFTWTGEKLGWDIFGTPADGRPDHNCIDLVNNETGGPGGDGYADDASDYPWEWCDDHYSLCNDSDANGRDDTTGERCKNGYTKAFPTEMPGMQSMALGGFWSGSPFMGQLEPLPPGEGGLNPLGAFVFMWHSHAEKELANFDIFPGGMMTQLYVEPPGTPIP